MPRHVFSNKFPVFRKAFIELAKNKNIQVTRTRQLHYLINDNNNIKIIEPSLLSLNKFGVRKVLINYYYKYVAKKLSSEYRVADGMIVQDELGILDVLKTLSNSVQISSNDKLLYLTVHPAKNFTSLETSNLKDERVLEYKFLKSNNFKKFINRNPLISFRGIL